MLGVAKINWCFSVRLEHTFSVCSYIWLKNSGFRVLFTKPISTFFSQKKKKNFKTRSQYTIHTFKNYFTIMFLVFSNKWYPIRPLV